MSGPLLDGRTCLVTGATSGVGQAVALELAARGARVLVGARDPAKATRGLAAIHDAGGEAEVVLVDLADLDSVRRAAADVLVRHPTLDLLVNNAGIHTARRTLTPQGFESTFATNHLGHFLLTKLLEPALRAAAPSRIVNVASEAHRAGALALDDLQADRRWSGLLAYARSKTANILHARELARRLDGTGVRVHAAHPGSVRTGWARGRESGLFRLAVAVSTPFLIAPERAAKNVLAPALSEEGGATSGLYWVRGKPTKPARHARDDEAARRLFEMSERMVAPWSGA